MKENKIIKDIVDDFLEENYSASYKQLFQNAEIEIKNYSEEDKIIFIDFLRDHFQTLYDNHYKICQNKNECYELKEFSKALFHLKNIFEKYGINNINKDFFSISEKDEFNKKLDEILEKVRKLELGQEIIYDDLENEINELKQKYYLGKKNWKQLLAGKTIEMVAGGILSETISKPLIEMSDIVIKKL